MEARYRSLSES